MGSETSPHSFRGSARRVRFGRHGGFDSPAPASSDVRISLPARPENVAVIRHLLGAFAEALQIPADVVDDMRLAITEACTNVVRHAYQNGKPGPIEVQIRPSGERLEIVVSDRGRGIGASGDHDGSGFGLPLIAALADTVELQHGASRGSRLAMSFPCRPRMEIA